MATQAERRNKTRLAIVRAAYDAFAVHGGPVVALEEIAQSAGVTKGSIHYHFDSRVGLLRAVATWLFVDIEQRVTASSQVDGKERQAERYVRALLVEQATPAGRVLFTVGDELLRLNKLGENIDPFTYLCGRLEHLGVGDPVTVKAAALMQFGRQLAFGLATSAEIDAMVDALELDGSRSAVGGTRSE